MIQQILTVSRRGFICHQRCCQAGYGPPKSPAAPFKCRVERHYLYTDLKQFGKPLVDTLGPCRQLDVASLTPRPTPDGSKLHVSVSGSDKRNRKSTESPLSSQLRRGRETEREKEAQLTPEFIYHSQRSLVKTPNKFCIDIRLWES